MVYISPYYKWKFQKCKNQNYGNSYSPRFQSRQNNRPQYPVRHNQIGMEKLTLNFISNICISFPIKPKLGRLKNFIKIPENFQKKFFAQISVVEIIFSFQIPYIFLIRLWSNWPIIGYKLNLFYLQIFGR